MKSMVVAVDARKNEVDPNGSVGSLLQKALVSLASLQRGQGGTIQRLEGESKKVRRLLEMGFVEGAYVEVLHEAPFGKDPIAVRVRGALLALRRSEAQGVWLNEVRG